jgi:TPR repeat protein
MKQSIKTPIGAVVVALALVGTAAADSLEDAYAAAKRGDYATAMRLWRPYADRGDSLAQSQIGWMYERGEGVPQDYVQAHFWYNLAASHDAPDYFQASLVTRRSSFAMNWPPR